MKLIPLTRKPITIQSLPYGELPVFSNLGNQLAYNTGKTNWRVIFYIVMVKVLSFGYDLWRYYLIDGFIERQMIKWIRRYIKKGVVLELGVGDGRLMRHVPNNSYYLGFDVFVREGLLKLAKQRGNATLFVASATDIPLPDRSVDFLISTEVMEHVVGVKKAIKEMYRVSKPGAKLLLSIPNNYCYKYARKGPHPEHVNNWRYKEFIEAMSPYFQVIEGRMNGWWFPLLPKVRYSYQIGWSHPDEYYNTNFLFVFERLK